MDSEHSNKVDKYKLQQIEAALKVKLAYVEQEKAIEVGKGTKNGRANTEKGS